ncbi:MAG: copper oxidase [Anaerolineae bacterium]
MNCNTVPHFARLRQAGSLLATMVVATFLITGCARPPETDQMQAAVDAQSTAMPMDHSGHAMGATDAMSQTMPMDHSGHAMGATDTMSQTMPMDHSGHAMGATDTMSHTMPMDHSGHAMGATDTMSHTMPMAMCANGMCADEMATMRDLMEQMKTATPEEHTRMMQDMMAMMQGLMNDMDGMDMTTLCQEDSCSESMTAMQDLMEQMKTATPAKQEQQMAQMMEMMQGMTDEMQAMHGMDTTEAMSHTMSVPAAMPMEHDSHNMAIPSEGVPAATVTTGGQPLKFTIENGGKVFRLIAAPVRWTLLNGVQATAWSYNGSVPGPMIRVTEGDAVRIILQNNLPEATSIHWHGMRVPNAMDGMIEIKPGDSFTYEFTAPAAGSYMYHSHINSDKQVGLGLYAPFIVTPKTETNPPDVDVSWMLSEWRIGADGETYSAMPMAGMEPNYFTINGKSYPDIPMIEAKMGQRVRIRLANIGQLTHPMHLHGMNFTVIAYDGVPLPPAQQIVRNTITVNPGELVDIELIADNPGDWMFHCHVLHHLTNNGVEPGGLLTTLRVIE